MSLESCFSSLVSAFWWRVMRATCGRWDGKLFREYFTGKAAAAKGARAEEIRTKCGLPRTKCVRLGNLMRRSPDAAQRPGHTDEASSPKHAASPTPALP